MEKAKIRFSVVGTITQEIEILNGESPEAIAEKLESGEYITSVAGHRTIERTANGERIAIIYDNDFETEYSNFEKLD